MSKLEVNKELAVNELNFIKKVSISKPVVAQSKCRYSTATTRI
ncbi:TPA: hypothetical protein ACGO9B_002148 [Streptococcus suis]